MGRMTGAGILGFLGGAALGAGAVWGIAHGRDSFAGGAFHAMAAAPIGAVAGAAAAVLYARHRLGPESPVQGRAWLEIGLILPLCVVVIVISTMVGIGLLPPSWIVSALLPGR